MLMDIKCLVRSADNAADKERFLCYTECETLGLFHFASFFDKREDSTRCLGIKLRRLFPLVGARSLLIAAINFFRLGSVISLMT